MNKKNIRRLLALLLVAVMLFGTATLLTGCKKEPVKPEEPDEPVAGETTESATETMGDALSKKNGWFVDEAGNVLYYVEDVPAVGFFHHESTGYYLEREFAPGWYYFDAQGLMLSGCWIEEAGYTHYLTEDGTAAASGWYSDSKGWFFLEEKGMLLANQVFERDGASYSVDADGYLFQVIHHRVTCELRSDEEAGKGSYLLLPQEYIDCVGLTFTFNSDLRPLGWGIRIRSGGEWKDIRELYDFQKLEDGKIVVTFREPMTFDALDITSGFNEMIVDPDILDLILRY